MFVERMVETPADQQKKNELQQLQALHETVQADLATAQKDLRAERALHAQDVQHLTTQLTNERHQLSNERNQFTRDRNGFHAQLASLEGEVKRRWEDGSVAGLAIGIIVVAVLILIFAVNIGYEVGKHERRSEVQLPPLVVPC